jgi:hypothetical protein
VRHVLDREKVRFSRCVKLGEAADKMGESGVAGERFACNLGGCGANFHNYNNYKSHKLMHGGCRPEMKNEKKTELLKETDQKNEALKHVDEEDNLEDDNEDRNDELKDGGESLQADSTSCNNVGGAACTTSANETNISNGLTTNQNDKVQLVPNILSSSNHVKSVTAV